MRVVSFYVIILQINAEKERSLMYSRRNNLGNHIDAFWAWINKIAEREPEPEGIVRPSKILLHLSIVLAIITFIPAILLPYTGVYVFVIWICWICFALLCLYIWNWFFCSVVYDQKGFRYKSLFGKQEYFSYNDITSISARDDIITVYIGEDYVAIHSKDKGQDAFWRNVAAHSDQLLRDQVISFMKK